MAAEAAVPTEAARSIHAVRSTAMSAPNWVCNDLLRRRWLCHGPRRRWHCIRPCFMDWAGQSLSLGTSLDIEATKPKHLRVLLHTQSALGARVRVARVSRASLLPTRTACSCTCSNACVADSAALASARMQGAGKRRCAKRAIYAQQPKSSPAIILLRGGPKNVKVMLLANEAQPDRVCGAFNTLLQLGWREVGRWG